MCAQPVGTCFSEAEGWGDVVDRTIRGTLFVLLSPAWTIGLLLLLRVKFHCSSYRYGKCHFYGPPAFLSSCQRAMPLLHIMDPALHDALTSKRLVCWQDSCEFSFAKGLCPISPGWSRWGEQGVITCLVYSYFHTLVFHGRSLAFPFARRMTLSAHQRVRSNVRAWLEKNGFPREIVASFVI